MSDLNLRSGNLSPAHVGAAKNYLGVVMTGGVQRWVAGVGLAGGAAAAAMMIGTPIARADTIDDFLIQAEGDMTQTATLFSDWIHRHCLRLQEWYRAFKVKTN
jgi:hypothetical protein